VFQVGWRPWLHRHVVRHSSHIDALRGQKYTAASTDIRQINHYKVILAAAFALVVLYASPAQACEECNDYFSDQSLEWCWRCDWAVCGSFQCVIRYYEGLNFEHCTGDNQCFEYGYGCMQEPQMRLKPERLDQVWHLARVRVEQSRPNRAAKPRRVVASATRG
jgi:hypothetical protein